MRLFIGSRLSAHALEGAGKIRDFASPYFGKSVTWVAPENLHVTCAFLGEVATETGLSGIQQRVDASTGAFREIGTTLGGLGAFPSFERPQVLWLGFLDGAAELKALALHLAGCLKRDGFAPAREFVPHVTLGRVKAPLDCRALAAVNDKVRGPGIRYTVSSLEVIESRISNAGTDYITLYSSKLL